MTTIEHLQSLEMVLSTTELPRAAKRWGGAGTAIIGTHPEAKIDDSWRQIRSVATLHSFELSWFFEALRDAFYAEGRVDSCSKFELFGRLANAANRCIAQPDKPTSHQEVVPAVVEKLAAG